MKTLKIFVEVGSHKMGFERLFKELDEMIDQGFDAKIFAQLGYTKYKPANYKSKNFLTEGELIKKIKWADVIVSHAGAGNIIRVLSLGKPLVLVPRKRELGEHTDNHQSELAKILEKEKKCISVNDITKLKGAIKMSRALKTGLIKEKEALEKQINTFIETLERK